MTRNVPVSLFDPYALKDNSDMWLKLNLDAKGNRDFTPIEIKTNGASYRLNSAIDR